MFCLVRSYRNNDRQTKSSDSNSDRDNNTNTKKNNWKNEREKKKRQQQSKTRKSACMCGYRVSFSQNFDSNLSDTIWCVRIYFPFVLRINKKFTCVRAFMHVLAIPLTIMHMLLLLLLSLLLKHKNRTINNEITLQLQIRSLYLVEN